MIIGIDLGGTKVAGGVLVKEKIVRCVQHPTEAAKGRARVIANIRSLIDDLAQGARISAVGIGVPGTYRGTRIVNLPNVTALNGVDLKRALKLACPVALDNDLRCVARAEARIGAAKGALVALVVNVGTGLGASYVFNGAPFRGAYGNASEAGHQWLDAEHTEWEHLLSGPALLARYRHLGGKGDRVSAVWTDRSRAGARMREEATELLARFIRNLVITFDPDRIVLTGGAITPAYAAAVASRLRSWGVRAPVRRALVKDPGVVGAALWMVQPTTVRHS